MEIQKRTPILIDCDPGVDDAFAIALAASCPALEITAITAVEGNVPAKITRKNALCLSELFDLPCRVGFGAEKPLKKAYDKDASAVHGEGGVGEVRFEEPKRSPDEKPACELIYEEAVKHSGELVLFATGPLTNIALALRAHPDLPEHVKRFYVMGGGTFGNVEETDNRAEFNIWVDPTAAKEVFSAMEVWLVGLDATHASALSGADFDEMIEILSGASNKKAAFLKELSAFSKRNSMDNGCDNHVIHDALTVAAFLDPAAVVFQDCWLDVETQPDAKNEGETYIMRNASKTNGHFAVQVDQPRFIRMLKDMCRFYAAAVQPCKN